MIGKECPACKCKHFRIYYSRNIAQCDNCLKEYNLKDFGKVEIKHQR